MRRIGRFGGAIVVSWAMLGLGAAWGDELEAEAGAEQPTHETAAMSEAAPSSCQACGESRRGCSCSDGCEPYRLLGCIAPSDHCFDRFISPQSNPLFFEDPRTLTEARFHYVHHQIPTNNPILQGGDVNFFALQLRAALSERLSIIAAKDGYIDLSPDNPALGDREGWADVALGLKYNLIRDVELQRIVSAGLTYELDVGAHRVFQGAGSGEFHLFLTGGQEIAEGTHWISASGFRLPSDTVDRSQMWYWSNHWDREFFPGIYGVFEVNWFHWMGSGENGLTNGFEGGDLFNLGSTGVAGNDIVTGAVGTRWKPYDDVETGVAYEFPLTERKDLLEDRWYFDLILRY